jgi:hypothetical protein
MSLVSEYEDHEGKLVRVTADAPPPSDEEEWEPTFTVTVGDRVTQQSVSVHEIIGYLSHVAHNASHVARRAGEIVYAIEGFCPAEPENVALDREDSGAALIFHPHTFKTAEDAAAYHAKVAEGDREEAIDEFLVEEPEHGMFVRIQSYDERIWEQNGALPEAHAEIRRIFGKRVRVTVEVLND